MQATGEINDLTSQAPVVLTLTPQDLTDVADELTAYHAHFAPLFPRREQREWAALYLQGLLLSDVPRKNIEAMALRLLGAGPMLLAPSTPSSNASVRAPGMLP